MKYFSFHTDRRCRKRNYPLWMLVVMLLACMHSSLFAGRGDKAGTAGAPQLLIPVGARDIALGGASLSTCSGLDAMYWNPAGLARTPRSFDVMFSHMNYLADIGVDYFAMGTNIGGSFVLGLSVQSLSIGDIPVTTEDQPDGTGQTVRPSFLTVGGTFGRRLSEKISVGLSVNFLYEKMGSVSATGFSFNGGVQYIGLGGLDGLSVGVAIKNLGPQMKYDGTGLDHTADVQDALQTSSTLRINAASADLPSTIEVGLGYAAQLYDAGEVEFESAFINNNFSDDEYKLGTEFTYDKRFSLRLGYAFSPQDQGGEYIYGLTAGVGVKSQVNDIDVTVNYAYRSVKYFSGNHAIELILAF